MFLMLTKYRRSPYYEFILVIIGIDIIMLIAIIFNMLSNTTIESLKGTFICKTVSFIVNTTRSFINWSWVMLFCQRFAIIYLSINRTKYPYLCFFEDSKKLLLFTALFSAATQLWIPFFISEVQIADENGTIIGISCGADYIKMGGTNMKLAVVAESLGVYVLPLIITVFADFSVLIFTKENSKW